MIASYSPAIDIQSPHYQDFPSYQHNFGSYLSNTQQQFQTQHQKLMSFQSQQVQQPPIRVQSSSPFTGDRGTQQQMLAQGPYLSGNTWGSNDNLLSPSSFARTAGKNFSNGYHKRASSASSLASRGPPSPADNNTVFPHIAGSDISNYSPQPFDSLDFFATTRGHMSKSLPTPVDTPVQNNFPSEYQNFASPHDVQNSQTMRRLQEHRAQNDDDVTSYAYSGPQSVSSASHHDSPATPQTFDGEFEDPAKNLQHAGFNPQLNMAGVPQMNFDDVYGNQLQNLPTQQQQQMMARAGGLSPYRTSLANRFQAAQLDHVQSRTASPTNSIQRERSPFRQESAYGQVSPVPARRLGPQQMVGAQYHQHMPNPSMLAQQQTQPQQQEPPKTVSPKDVELDYHEENEPPLFPSSQTSQFSLPREESTFSNAFPSSQPNQYYTTVPMQTNSAYPFMNQQRRQQSSMKSGSEQSMPDFPASLASMETTVSSSSEHEQTPTQAPTSIPVQRPANTSSDLGTYTCTYHGCSQRFDSPARLQKHRRDAHRQPSPHTPATTASPVSSTASDLGHVASANIIAARNSQAGPHKCDRVNPTTGKPCNSIFSRPYDLTRHEDTIHNNRKFKVRCHLCTEEKTFSRNDALTRHMRVVHPDVDWPGKTKRKGGRD